MEATTLSLWFGRRCEKEERLCVSFALQCGLKSYPCVQKETAHA